MKCSLVNHQNKFEFVIEGSEVIQVIVILSAIL